MVTFADKEELAKWRRMDDVIMGGQSQSGWTVSDDVRAAQPLSHHPLPG